MTHDVRNQGKKHVATYSSWQPSLWRLNPASEMRHLMSISAAGE
jgi:hypothetical protein